MKSDTAEMNFQFFIKTKKYNSLSMSLTTKIIGSYSISMETPPRASKLLGCSSISRLSFPSLALTSSGADSMKKQTRLVWATESLSK